MSQWWGNEARFARGLGVRIHSCTSLIGDVGDVCFQLRVVQLLCLARLAGHQGSPGRPSLLPAIRTPHPPPQECGGESPPRPIAALCFCLVKIELQVLKMKNAASHAPCVLYLFLYLGAVFDGIIMWALGFGIWYLDLDEGPIRNTKTDYVYCTWNSPFHCIPHRGSQGCVRSRHRGGGRATGLPPFELTRGGSRKKRKQGGGGSPPGTAAF